MSVYVGAPATIQLYTDTLAAVVTKVTKHRVWVARVDTIEGSQRTENETEVAAGAFPVILRDGDTSKIIGQPIQYSLYLDSHGDIYATKGDRTVRVRFGRSIERVDYRF